MKIIQNYSVARLWHFDLLCHANLTTTVVHRFDASVCRMVDLLKLDRRVMCPSRREALNTTNFEAVLWIVLFRGHSRYVRLERYQWLCEHGTKTGGINGLLCVFIPIMFRFFSICIALQFGPFAFCLISHYSASGITPSCYYPDVGCHAPGLENFELEWHLRPEYENPKAFPAFLADA